VTSTEHKPDLLEQLAAGVSRLTDSEEWIRHLACQSRFHRYSFGNALLIASQCPDATRVAGFRAWNKMGRSVSKGERALWILAPMVMKKADDGKPEGDRVLRGFKQVPVFDISQTEGDELPAACHRLSGAEPIHCFEAMTDVARSIGYTVEGSELSNGVNGDCNFGLRRIRVEIRNEPAQQLKSLVHEIAHALLHQGERDRPLAELEAESTAYVVCHHLGLDTGAYSFGYVTTWAGGQERATAAIRSSGARIQIAASTILGALGEGSAATEGGEEESASEAA
jgi:hypothetical protein